MPYIVYANETDVSDISSLLNEAVTIRSASIENIIVDKLAACYRFAGGNTRMKDFDDRWRLSRTENVIDRLKLNKLLKNRKIESTLDSTWIGDDFTKSWNAHQSRYKELPQDAPMLFEDVNRWLKQMGF